MAEGAPVARSRKVADVAQHEARRAGIEERELDGGYVVNGWLQYAHPEHAARAPDGDVRVPWINVEETLRYGIVNRAPAGARVLHEVAYRRILAPSGRIYVIDQMPGASGSLLFGRDVGG